MSKKLDELIKDLSEPFPYDWRIQSRNKDKTKAVCTAFVDARTVQDILDAKCAKHNATWDVDYKELAGVIFCGITITIDNNTATLKDYECSTRWDAGNRLEENQQDRLYVQGGKSAASDAFKRAAVMFGLGRFLYNIAPMSLPCDSYNVLDDRGQKVYDLTTYVRGMGKKPTSKRKKETAPVVPPTAPVAPVVKKLKKLTENSFRAMEAAIYSGNYEAVESVIDKYDVTEDQKKVLDTAIAAAKAKAAIKPNESN